MKLRILTVEGLLQPQADDRNASLCSWYCPHLRRNDWAAESRCWFYGRTLVEARDSVLHERCAPCLQGTEVEA